MLLLLKELRERVVTGFVGGSDLIKITEQLSLTGKPGMLSLLLSDMSTLTCHWR